MLFPFRAHSVLQPHFSMSRKPGDLEANKKIPRKLQNFSRSGNTDSKNSQVTSGQRHPFLARWKVGVNKDGKIQALDADVFCNAGWSQDLSAAVCDRALSHIDGCYRIPNVHVRGRLCRTNTMSNTAFRGFGGPQGYATSSSICFLFAQIWELSMPREC